MKFRIQRRYKITALLFFEISFFYKTIAIQLRAEAAIMGILWNNVFLKFAGILDPSLQIY